MAKATQQRRTMPAKCPECGAAAKHTFKDKVRTYECGTRARRGGTGIEITKKC